METKKTVKVTVANCKTSGNRVGWAKVVTGIDHTQRGGYMLLGHWLRDGQHMLLPGTVVVFCAPDGTVARPEKKGYVCIVADDGRLMYCDGTEHYWRVGYADHAHMYDWQLQFCDFVEEVGKCLELQRNPRPVVVPEVEDTTSVFEIPKDADKYEIAEIIHDVTCNADHNVVTAMPQYTPPVTDRDEEYDTICNLPGDTVHVSVPSCNYVADNSHDIVMYVDTDGDAMIKISPPLPPKMMSARCDISCGDMEIEAYIGDSSCLQVVGIQVDGQYVQCLGEDWHRLAAWEMRSVIDYTDIYPYIHTYDTFQDLLRF